MAIGKRLKNLKGWIKEKTRQSAPTSPARPTHALPDDPTLISDPAPRLLAVPSGPSAPPGPLSAPPAGGPAASEDTWLYLGGLLLVLSKSPNLFEPLKTAMDDLSQCFALFEDAARARRDYQVLKTKLELLFNTLNSHFAGDVPPTMTESMNSLCRSIEGELDRISIKEARRAGRRYLEANKDLDEVLACYRRIQGHLERLTLNADLSTWKIVDKLATDAALDKLKPSMSACYNSAEASLVRRRECIPETRKQVLAELNDWRHVREQGNIYWLNGMAGTGKTTIATTLCSMLERSHDLGASFFCTRQLPECRNVKLILPTIAYQLACFSQPFRCALSRVLGADPNVHTKALPIQLERMILAPLREVAQTLPTDLVVVIDALDECDDSDGVGQILGLLVKHASQMPIKVFVSSRPEPQIRQKIGSTKSQLVLHELDSMMVKSDIELYFRTELECMSLSDSHISSLVERAGVLFIYAATVVRYIGEDDFSLDPQERLDSVLGALTSHRSEENQEIDELYSLILSSVLDSPKLRTVDRDRIELVLHTVICAQEPLTLNALARLLQLKNVDQVQSSLRRLWSVLHISKASNLVSTLHASFPDYMLDPQRSKLHGCNAAAHHGRLAELCLERVQSNKRQFNICELESSYVFDEQVQNLEERVNQAIPLDLAYASQYWAIHLEKGESSIQRVQLLHEFLSTRLLLWMEVLNLRKQIHIGPTLLVNARKWCMDQEDNSDTKTLLHDAWRFVTTFAANPVSRSTPHIYVSMLASWPRSRPIAERYIPRTRHLIEFSGSAMAKRELDLLGVFNTSISLASAALSPDGTCIVAGCGDNKIRVWDAQNGQLMLGPLEGHTDQVNSVAFSPDGMRIASGSKDKTVRVWDTQSGQMTFEPLEGHTGSVESVAFSPDTIHIASASADKTIRVWDVQAGGMVMEPIQGHTSSVFSVAFSPDGMRLVSGSDDKTIRVWDVQGGQLMLGPLEGHTELVSTVAFSPDGARIISSAMDKTIRVWDARTGQDVLSILQKHINTFSSPPIAVSPNSMHVVSGSADLAIQVWDAETGEMLLGPLKGHTDWVRSISFSSDGMRIISASKDQTIRVWDAQSGPMIPEPLDGHTGSVTSVAFSPNGARMVSGSGDKTIRVWDVHKGQMVLGPLEGHTEQVTSVAFSPDTMRIVSGGWDGTIRVWDGQSGEMVLGPLEGHANWISSVAISPNGMFLVSGSDDGTLRMWDGQNGEMVLGPLKRHTHWVNAVAFSPDGMRIVSGSDDRTIRVWDARSGQPVLKPLKGHTRVVKSVVFSPDAMRIASGSTDLTIRLWDSQSGKLMLAPLVGHTGSVNSVAFSPDGMRVVSGSFDKTIRVWNAESGEVVWGPLMGHTSSVNSVAFSPDGMCVISGSEDQMIRIWRMPNSSSDSVTSTRSLSPMLPSCISTPWELDEDGWVREARDQMLLWVPRDLQGRLLRPFNTHQISTRGSVQLGFDHTNIGESWVECYSPE